MMAHAAHLPAEGAAKEGLAGGRRGARNGAESIDDQLLDRYLRRLDPEVAASFDEAQRQAIMSLLGLRGIVRHAFELRRSVPLLGRRYYFVLLLGREKRSLMRLYSEGQNSALFNLSFYVVSGLLAVLPLLLLFYLL